MILSSGRKCKFGKSVTLREKSNFRFELVDINFSSCFFIICAQTYKSVTVRTKILNMGEIDDHICNILIFTS